MGVQLGKSGFETSMEYFRHQWIPWCIGDDNDPGDQDEVIVGDDEVGIVCQFVIVRLARGSNVGKPDDDLYLISRNCPFCQLSSPPSSFNVISLR